MRKERFEKKLNSEEKQKALKWGLSKFITRLLQLTEVNYRKLKKYLEELLEGQSGKI